MTPDDWRPKWSRRGFLYLAGAGAVGLVTGLPKLPAPAMVYGLSIAEQARMLGDHFRLLEENLILSHLQLKHYAGLQEITSGLHRGRDGAGVGRTPTRVVHRDSRRR